jgi:hypothetical protein
MNYPCNCKDMKWMMDHNKVFKKSENRWLLTWIELDKEDKKGINIEQLGVVINHCIFCGNKISNVEE